MSHHATTHDGVPIPQYEHQTGFALLLVVVVLILFGGVAWAVRHFGPQLPPVPSRQELRLQAIDNAKVDARTERATKERGVHVDAEDLAKPTTPQNGH